MKDKELLEKSPALHFMKHLLDNQPKPQKPKRKPLLLDEVLANPHKDLPKDALQRINAVKARLANAKVFKFDEDAAVYAAQMMRDYPEAIAHDLDFCIPPFQQMYIEFPFPKFYEVLTPPDIRVRLTNAGYDDQDTDVGYFYDGPSVYVMSRAANVREYGLGMLLPLRFRLNKAFTFQEEQELAKFLEESRLGIDTFFWGSCHPTLLRRHDHASIRALRERHSCEVWYGSTEVPLPMAHLLRTNAGDLRSIVAFLLFLNRTKDVQVVEEVRPAGGFVRAKPRTLVRHNVIHIKLDPGPMLQRKFLDARTTGGWRREHDVRGHFCHDRNYHGAHHEHELREIRHQHWKCLKCNGHRWWRKAHHRGSPKAGQVLTAYEVEK